MIESFDIEKWHKNLEILITDMKIKTENHKNIIEKTNFIWKNQVEKQEADEYDYGL